jgi:hypothetical protein
MLVLLDMLVVLVVVLVVLVMEVLLLHLLPTQLVALAVPVRRLLYKTQLILPMPVVVAVVCIKIVLDILEFQVRDPLVVQVVVDKVDGVMWLMVRDSV